MNVQNRSESPFDDCLVDFLDESDLLIGVINRRLLELEDFLQLDRSNRVRMETHSGAINEIFRAFHSIKGVSGMLALSQINRLTHAIEGTLDRVRSFGLVCGTSLIEAFFRAADRLESMCQSLRSTGEESHEPDLEDFIRWIETQASYSADTPQLTETADLPMEPLSAAPTGNTRKEPEKDHTMTTSSQPDPLDEKGGGSNSPSSAQDNSGGGEFDASRYLQLYLDETVEEIDRLVETLLSLENEPQNRDLLNEGFRMAHRIKGSSSVMGFEDVTKLTHEVENIFDVIRAGECTLNDDLLNVVLRAVDQLRDHHKKLAKGAVDSTSLDEATQLVIKVFEQQKNQNQAPVESAPPSSPVAEATPADSMVRYEIEFVPGLMFADMKAELILFKLGGAATILRSDPSPEEVAKCTTLDRLVVELDDVDNLEKILKLGDVDGVKSIRATKLSRDGQVIGQASLGSVSASEARPSSATEAVSAATVLDRSTTTASAVESTSHAENDRRASLQVPVVSAEADDSIRAARRPDQLEVTTPMSKPAASKSSPATETPAIAASIAPSTANIPKAVAAPPKSQPMPMQAAPIPAVVEPAKQVAEITAKVTEASKSSPTGPSKVDPVVPATNGKSPVSKKAEPTKPAEDTSVRSGSDEGSAAGGKVSETLRVDIDRLDHLMNLAGELVINKARFVQISAGLQGLFKGKNAYFASRDITERLSNLSQNLQAAKEKQETTVDLDAVMSHVARLTDDFRAVQDELDRFQRGRQQYNAMGEAIHQLSRVADGIQKSVMDTRMVPIGPLFIRFKRVVRDVARVANKEVSLEIHGEKTELDKRMIDELGDPLIHMIRNAVDHGIETPQDRIKAGKPAHGTVRLDAMHRGNNVIILVQDDGRGINHEILRKKIVEKGLLAEAEANALTEKQVLQYIWHPGFSTAAKITDISGRGVGMDIVRSKIEELSGTVDLKTVVGQGTTFTIRLPLTLAILPSLLTRVCGEVYSMPLENVEEIVKVPRKDVFSVGGQAVIRVRGRVISLIRLREVFCWPDSQALAPEGEESQLIVVILSANDTQVALVVDHLIGEDDIVIKSLAHNYQNVKGLAGASILGDGRVSLILDVGALVDMVAKSVEPMPVLV